MLVVVYETVVMPPLVFVDVYVVVNTLVTVVWAVALGVTVVYTIAEVLVEDVAVMVD